MSLFIPPNARATDASSNSLSGAGWYFYVTGTLTLAASYTTVARNVAHAHPVVADAGGKFPSIYLDPAITYRAILKTAGGVTLFDIDPYDQAASASEVNAAITARPTSAALAATGGAALIGSSDGSTVQAKLDELEDTALATLGGFRDVPHSDFNWHSIRPRVDGVNVVETNMSVVAYCIAAYSPPNTNLISAGTLYVAAVGAGGSNANTGTHPGAALADIDYAVSTASPTIVYLLGSNDPDAPAVFRKFDFRYDDTRGGILKIIRPLGHCVIEEEGDAASSLTWTAAGSLYDATPTIVSSAVPAVIEYTKVLREDGHPFRLPKLASSSAVNTAGLGWHWDGTDLYIRYGALDIEANKADFKITYSRADGLSRCMFLATRILLDVAPGNSLTFRGVMPLAIANGSNRAYLYMRGVTILNSPDHGLDSQGAQYMAEDCTIAFSKADNFHPANLSAVTSLALEINCLSYEAGDFDTNGVTAGGTTNGSSMHSGGHVARFGGHYYLNGGPDIVDTGTGKSWNVGVKAGRSRATSNGYGFWATTSTVTMYLDTCHAYDEPIAELATGVGCTMYKFNTTGRVSIHLGTVASFVPANV